MSILTSRGNQLLTFLRLPSCHVEIDSHDQCSGESQPRVSTSDENPSVVLQRGVAVALLFGLIASGQIQLRRIDGYQRLSEVLEHAEVAA